MTCISDKIIQKFVDGEAGQEEILRIEKHLSGCTGCARRVEHRRKFSTGIKNALGHLLNEETEIPVWKETFTTRERKMLPQRRWIYATVAAAAALVLLLIVFTHDRQGEDVYNPMHEMEWEYNANQPISQQDMIIWKVDPQGAVVEYVIE